MDRKEALEFLELPEYASPAEIKEKIETKLAYFENLSEKAPSPFVRKLHARNAIVVTDYDVHAMWLCRTVDRYYVAIDEAAEYLARIGVPREKLRVTGIPIDPLFAKPLERAEARRALGLDPSAPAILISASASGADFESAG